MRIAIDGRLLADAGAKGLNSGLAVTSFLLKNPGRHQFFLVSDKSWVNDWGSLPGVTFWVLKPIGGLLNSKKIWYDYKLPNFLAIHKIDIFLGLSGYISLKTRVKQVIWLQDALEAKTLGLKCEWARRRYLRRLVTMAKQSQIVIVPSTELFEFGNRGNEKRSLNEKIFALPVVSLSGLPLGLNIPDINSSPMPEPISDLLNGRMPYFLCIEGWQSTQVATELLLAFSAFKKRMQSGMKLVLAGSASKDKTFLEKLSTYRYRSDVILLPPVSKEWLDLVSFSAYCLIYLPDYSGFSQVLKWLQGKIPVIIYPKPYFSSLLSNVVMYCTHEPGESLSQNLMRMYKDEKMRSELIERGFEWCKALAPEVVAEKLLLLCTPDE